jgi:hypothetical protein
VTTEPGPRPPAATGPASPRVFQHEIRDAIRYERGLAVKALVVLAVVAVIVILRALYFG